MATPQLIWQLSKGFFIRNNPAEVLLRSMFEFCHNFITFRSKMKLLHYKFMLAQQQLRAMEEHVIDNPYEVKGVKFDRPF
jgi:hypothetical protein